MGAQFDATVTAVLGVVIAVLWSFAGLASSVAYNLHHSDHELHPNGNIINACFLFVGVFWSQILRQIYPKFHFFSLQFMIIQIFTMTRGLHYVVIPFKLPLNYGIPLLIGHAISLLVNLLIWPETAVDGLGRALRETITSSQDMLHLITKQFFLDPNSDSVPESVVNEAASKMRVGMTKVKTAYHEAKYEISYAYVHPQQLSQIQKSLDRLTKHLNILGSCLKIERELFESAIEVLQAEMKDYPDMTDEDDTSSYVSGRASFSQRHSYDMSDNEETHRSSLSRPSYSEEDLNLLRNALRATNDFMNNNNNNSSSSNNNNSNNKHTNSYLSANNISAYSSRTTSRASSRPGSTHNSDDDRVEGEEEDYTEHNQKSVSSFKSFLNLPRLSIPKPKPPKKSKKQTEYHHRHLLLTYLEGLRDPLMDLSLDCSTVLECICDSIANEFDMDPDDDDSIRQTWKSFLQHTFRIGNQRDIRNEESIKRSVKRHKGNEKCNCSQNIRLAITHFDNSERDRMHALYEIKKAQSGLNNTLDLGMRQELFLVFFFIFTMREVATELQEMAIQMDELRLNSRKGSLVGKRRKHFYFPIFKQKKWQKWARGSNHQSTRDKGGYTSAVLTSHIPKDEPTKNEVKDEYNQLQRIQTNNSLKRTLSHRSSLAKKLPRINISEKAIAEEAEDNNSSPILVNYRRQKSPYLRRKDESLSPPSLSLNKNNEQNKKKTDEDSELTAQQKREEKIKTPIMLHIRYGIWLRLQYLRRYEFKFALKMAIAVLLLCLPAFIPESSSWYYNVRGQWAALTVIAIMNPTSGGTLQASIWRIVGTLVGAFVGWAALEAGGGSPYLLGLFAVLLAIPFFYIHLGSTYNKVGIVTLVTYMVVALSRYAFPTPGETFAATVCLVWPFVARNMVRKSLASCLIQLEDYYTYVIGTFLYHNPYTLPNDEEITKSIKLENRIQSAIDTCSVLLELTDHEPRFRGPFPKLFYKEMIVSVRNILDRLLSIRTALLQMPLEVKRDICEKAYHADRRDLTASILLSFHLLASSLRSKTPLPIYMPSARTIRMKLLESRRANQQKVNWTRFRNLTWFAMACSTGEIIDELEYLSKLVRYIVGESDYAELVKKIDDFENYP
ncbi:uncharacterized protein BX663DRAFT_529215 [Cokeromyces recurvatus]|uniref:uncharacterized protein n=1 Tax=Cokeromyces recurvatus TaxID=90255 RepID=UPI0022209283|nr:uncharacterized protein BX663DRAFT_529215 [Cokeromyces recurvatus]KAI7906491.1 hypothetical protein BX663DRAFT_529215 [Cokeromyces recurvatus]